MENILKIENIEKYYGSKSSLTKAIDNISFEVEKGEFVAIMGSSVYTDPYDRITVYLLVTL